MCGQCGIIIGNAKRSERDFDYFRDVFSRLLRLNQGRGHHAAGAAVVSGDCGYQLLKRPVESSTFVNLYDFYDLMKSVNENTTLMMGHTRFATVGSIEKISNGHPIKSGCCLATANGTIFNADRLFRKFRLHRFAEVDSELIARLADKHAPDGEIKLKNFVHSLRHCRGQISALVTSLLDPQKVIVLKGNKPLSLRYNPKLRAIIYSSDASHLDIALKGNGNWKELKLAPMSCALFDIRTLPKFEIMPFVFKREKRRKILCVK